MSIKKNVKKKKFDSLKNKIIKRQTEEIDFLKNEISSLEIDLKKKEELNNSLNVLRDDLTSVVFELREQKEEYDRLIREVTEMKNAMNKIVYKNKWSLVRLLLK